MYYINLVDANSFKLKNSGGTVIDLGETAGLGGTHTIGVEGIDFTSVGSGAATLRFDLDAAGSTGTHRLVGIGGARSFLSAPPGDGMATATATGSGGGLISVLGSNAHANALPIVSVVVGNDAVIRATGSISLTSTSFANATANATNKGGGFVGVGQSDATTTAYNQNSATIGDRATLVADGNVSIVVTGTIKSNVSADSNAKGFVGVADTDATLAADYDDAISIGANAHVTATNALNLAAHTTLDLNGDGDATGSGLGANSSASTWVIIGNTAARTETVVNGGATLNGFTTQLYAIVDQLKGDAKATTDSDALGADADAYAHFTDTDTAQVVLNSGALVGALDLVELKAQHVRINTDSNAEADCDCGGGDTDTTAENSINATSLINVANGAVIKAPNVAIKAYSDNSPDHDKNADSDGALIDLGDEEEPGDLTDTRKIVFNGTLVAASSAELIVDATGNIIRQDNVTVVTNATSITVNDIDNLSVRSVLFEADPFDGSIITGNPDINLADTWGFVRLWNHSTKHLIVNKVTNPITGAGGVSATLAITVEDQSGFVLPASAHGVSATSIEIQNFNTGGGDVIFQDVVENPIGDTRVTVANGSILAQSTNPLLRANNLWLDAQHGTIGSSTRRLPVDLVQSATRPTHLTALANGDVYLDLTGRLREVTTNAFVVNAETLNSATANINLLLEQSIQQTTNGDSLTPQRDLGLFGTGTTPVTSTYQFGLLQASNITIGYTSTATAPVHLTANTNILSTGVISTTTNGDTALAETNGDMRVAQVKSTAGSVALTAAASILDAEADAASDVFGVNITLGANNGTLGVSSDELEIDSSFATTGTVTLYSAESMYVKELTGDVNLTTATSAGGSVYLNSAGGIFDANSGAMNLVAATAIFTATSGIGTASAPIHSLIYAFESTGGTGGVYLVNGTTLLQRPLIIGGLGTTNGITATDNISITLVDTQWNGDDIAVPTGSRIHSTGGAVALYVGDNLILPAGSFITASQQITIYVDYNPTADGVGASFNPLGSVRGSLVEIFGGEDSDTILIPATQSETIINAGGLDDRVTIQNTGAFSTTINSGVGVDHVLVQNTGAELTINGDDNLDWITIQNTGAFTTTINGGEADDMILLWGVPAGATVVANGGNGADKFIVGRGVTETMDITSISATLTSLNALQPRLDSINGSLEIHGNGDPGCAGTGQGCRHKDELYLSDAGSAVGVTGTLSNTVVSGFSLATSITIDAEFVFIQLSSGNDTFDVQGVAPGLVVAVYGGAGDDTVNVGNAANLLTDIDGVISFMGEGGSDTLNVNNSGDTADCASAFCGQLTALALSGFGMGDGAFNQPHIYYAWENQFNDIPLETYETNQLANWGDIWSTTEQISITLGSGNDILAIDSASPASTVHVFGNDGDDTFIAGATQSGLYPDSLRHARFISGTIALDGGAGDDTTRIDNSGEDQAFAGTLNGSTFTVIGMANGIVNVAVLGVPTIENFDVLFGAQNDILYLAGTTAGVTTTINMGGGFDRVYAGSTCSANCESDNPTLSGNVQSGILGAVRTEGDQPEADDVLYLNDQLNTTGNQWTILNEPDHTITLTTGSPWMIDRTIVTTTGSAALTYLGFETVVLNAGAGDDVIDLYGTHREQAVEGRASTFVVNTGAGSNLVLLGKPAGPVTRTLENFSLDETVRGIPVMVNGQGGSDIVHFDYSAAVSNTNAALTRRTFAEIFPSETISWTQRFQTYFGGDPAATSYTSVIFSGANALNINANARNAERIVLSLGSGDDIFRLVGGVTYDHEIVVHGNGGKDTFNIDRDATTLFPVILNGGEGDDTAFVNFGASVGDAQVTANTVLAFQTGALVPSSSTRLAEGRYYVEVRNNGGAFQFRMLDAAGSPIQIANGISTTFTSNWQSIVAGTYDTLRGIIVGFGTDTALYQAGTKAANTAAYVWYDPGGAPNGTLSLTFNGGNNGANGDMLRIQGDGVAVGDYTPSSTEARSGVVHIRQTIAATANNTYSFTGVEPLVIQGLSAFHVVEPDVVSELTVETIDVADMNLSNLVLHVVTVDGVITWRQQVKLEGTTAVNTKTFGRAVAMDGDTLAVGADRMGDSTTGVVYIYVRSGSNWIEEAKLYPWDATARHTFGSVLALSGNLLVVGDPNNGSTAWNTTNGTGAVYVFRRSSGVWTREARLAMIPGVANSHFGATVATNGAWVLVGAPDLVNGANTGAAFWYYKDASGWGLKQTTYDVGHFGSAVAIAGSWSAVGQPDNSQVKMYQQSGTTWTYTGTLTASEAQTGEKFGAALAMNGSRLVVGAPYWDGKDGTVGDMGRAFVFDYDGTGWVRVARLAADLGLPASEAANEGKQNDHFGLAVALDNSNHVIIGAPDYTLNSSSQGAAYLFYYLPDGCNCGYGTWLRSTDKLVTPYIANVQPLQNDRLGIGVAVSGNYAVVGIPGDASRQDIGSIKVYATNGTMNHDAYDNTDPLDAIGLRAGENLSQSSGGFGGKTIYDSSSRQLLVSAPSADKIYVYVNEGLYWRPLSPISGWTGYQFGRDMDLDGDWLVVGASYSAWLYQRSGETWTYRDSAVDWGNPDFATSVAISGDNIVVGVPGRTVNYSSQSSSSYYYSNKVTLSSSGVVYVYNKTNMSARPIFLMPYDEHMPESSRRIVYDLHSPSVTVWTGYTEGDGDCPDGCKFTGDSKTFYEGEYSDLNNYSRGSSDWNDMIGSARFADYTRLRVYEHKDYGGLEESFPLDYWASWWDPNDYGGYGINWPGNHRTWSSMKVECRSPLPGCHTSHYETNSFSALDNAGFGSSVDIVGNTVVVGASNQNGGKGRVLVYDLGGTTKSSWVVNATLSGDYNYADWHPLLPVKQMIPTAAGTTSVQNAGSVGTPYGQCSVNALLMQPWTGTVDSQGEPVDAARCASGFPVVLTDTLFGLTHEVWTDGSWANYTVPSQSYSKLGSQVVLTSDTLFAGASGNDSAATNGGAVFVYSYSGATWTEASRIYSPAPASNGHLGNSFTIGKTGDYLLLGAPGEGNGHAYLYSGSGASWTYADVQLSPSTSLPTFGGGPEIVSDGHYVAASNSYNTLSNYRQRGPAWTASQTITPSQPPTSQFGNSVAIYGDMAVVGAPRYDGRGAVYTYVRQNCTSGPNAGKPECWSAQATIQPGDVASNDRFGEAVSLFGSTLAVGASGAGTSNGAVYLFQQYGTSWSQQVKLMPAGPNSKFGAAVDISGDTVVIGAPGGNAAYIFVRNGATWSQQWARGDSGGFGTSVALDGDTAIIGAPNVAGGGAAFVYTRTGTAWTLQQGLYGTFGVDGDQFGRSVDVYGNRAVVGAPGANQSWSVADTGAVYVYYRNGVTWYQQQAITLSTSVAGDAFGTSVAIYGERIIVGAPNREVNGLTNEGVAYAFQMKRFATTSTGLPLNCDLTLEGKCFRLTTIVAPLTGSDAGTGDNLGQQVALYGNLVIAGAPQLLGRHIYDSNATDTNGAGYVYITELTPPTLETFLEEDALLLQGAHANIVRGTVGGVTVSDLYIFDVPVLTITTGAVTDTITVNADGLTAQGLKELIIQTGAGDDRVTMLAASLALPGANMYTLEGTVLQETNFTFDGGAGNDTLEAPAILQFTFTETGITSSAGGRLTVVNIEFVEGGCTFDITSWTGGPLAVEGGVGDDWYYVHIANLASTLTINDIGGAVGIDHLVIVGTDASDLITINLNQVVLGAHTVNYYNIEDLIIATQNGNDIIVLDDSSAGSLLLDGQDGSDTYVIPTVALNVVVKDTGQGPFDELDVIGTDSADTITVNNRLITIGSLRVTYDDNVERLNVFAGSGNDTLNGTNPIDAQTSVVLDGEGGTDTCAAAGPFITCVDTSSTPGPLIISGTINSDVLRFTASDVIAQVSDSDGNFQSYLIRSYHTSIEVRLLDGDDQLTIEQVPNILPVTLLGQAGLDIITIADLATVTVGKSNNLTIDGGWDTNTVLVNTSASDDAVTLTGTQVALNGVTRAVTYANATYVTLNLLAGNDTVTIDPTGVNRSPVFTVNDGDGADTLFLTQNTNLILSDSLLHTSGGLHAYLNSIEIANLTGGPSVAFDVSGWTGTGTLTGTGAGNVVAATKNGDFTLVNGSLRTSDGMSMTLANITIANLTGGAGDNHFYLTGWSGSGTLNGSTGTDQLVLSQNTSFNLSDTALSRGSGGAFTLSNIEDARLTGGAGANVFTLSGWTGTATLISDSADRLVLTHDTNFTLTNSSLLRSGGGAVALGAIKDATLTGGTGNNAFTYSENWAGATGIASFDGAGGTDTLIAPNTLATTNWYVTGTNAGNIDGRYWFSNMENLTGGTGDDNFIFQSGSVAGTIAGGGQVTQDALDYSLNGGAAITVNLQLATATSTGGFSGIEYVIGSSNGGDTLVGANAANTWNITGINWGNIGGTFAFSSVENLTGGASQDLFLFDSTDNVTGTVDGGDDVDQIFFTMTPSADNVLISAPLVTRSVGTTTYANIETMTLDARAGADVITITETAIGFPTSVIVYGSDGDDAITVNLTAGATTTINLDGGAPSASDSVTVNGTAGADTIAVNGLSVTFGATTVALTNVENLTVAAGGGNDDLSLTGTSVPGTLTLLGEVGSDTITLDYPITTGALIVNGGANAGDALWVYTTDNADNVTLTGTMVVVGGAALGGSATALYAGFDWLILTTFGDSDQITITNTGAVTTTIYGGNGNDAILVQGTSGVLLPFGEAGDDTFNVQSIGGETWLDGGDGADVINVSSNAPLNTGVLTGLQGVLYVISGGGGMDVLNISESGSAVADTILVDTAVGEISSAIVPFTIYDVYGYFAAGIHLWTGSAGDTINIRSANANEPVTIHAGGGDDTFNVSSDAPTNSGTLNDIHALLTIDGGAGANTLNVSDAGDATANTGTLTATALTGLGMTGGITYGTVETLNIALGSGADQFTIQSTHSNTTNVHTGAGADTVDIRTIAGVTTVNAGDSDDTLNVSSDAPAHLGNLDGIAATLTMDAGAGANTLVVSDYAGATANANVGVTANQITGFAGPSDNVAINYAATSGTFGNLTLEGSNTVADTFHLGTPNGQLTLNANGGNDAIYVDDLTIAATINGGAGSDTLCATNDVANITLTNASLARKGLGTLTLSGIEVANLTGGLGANTFDVSGWTGTGALNGLGNTNTVSATKDVALFTLTDNLLTTSDGMSLALTNITIANLTGGATANTFDIGDWIGTGSVDGLTDPSTSSGDTLIAATIFNITGLNSGNTDGLVNFTNVENLIGGPADDRFVFSNGAGVSGSIDGQGGSNTLDYAAYTTAITLNLQLSTATGIGGTFANIQTFVGGSSSDTMTGANVAGTWNIIGTNAGNIGGALWFSGIENLVGGAGDDTFAFQPGGNLSATIAGGGQVTQDALDYSLNGGTVITVNLQLATATSTGGFSGIENLIGSTNTGDTLVGANAANIWNITSINSGNIGAFTFSAIENLTGGVLADTFIFASTGNATGTVDGAAGADELVFNMTSGADNVVIAAQVTRAVGTSTYANVETITLNALAGADTVTVNPTVAGFPATVNVNASDGDDVITVNLAAGATTTINVDGGLPTASDLLTINGTPSGDIIAVNGLSVTFGATTVALTNVENLTVAAGGGNDDLSLTGTSVPGTLSLFGEAGEDWITLNYPITTGTLIVDGGANANDALWVNTTDNADNVTLTDATVAVGGAALGGSATAHYAGFAWLILTTFGGSDQITVTNTGAITTTIYGGDSNDTIRIQGTSGALFVYGDAGDDTFNVQSIGGETWLDGGDGADVINVSSNAPLNTGVLTGLHATLTVDGNGGGTDTLNISERGSAVADTIRMDTNGGMISSAVVPFTIRFGGSAAFAGGVYLWIGSAGDTINIRSIYANEPVTVYAGDGDDTLNIGPVNSVNAQLTVNGADGSDTLNVSDAGDAGANIGTLTATTLTGLGMTDGITYNTVETMNVTLGDGGNTFNIESTASGMAATINGGSGDETFNVGASGSLDQILGVLFLYGNAPTASDVLNINDQVETVGHVYTLTATTIDRTGAAQITYGTIEQLNINSGSGSDTFTIQSTHANATMVNTGAGADTITLNGTSGTTTVNAGADSDTVQANSITGITTLNGDEGNDAFTLLSVHGTTTASGNAGDDTVVVNLDVGSNGTLTVNGGTENDTITVLIATVPTTINGGDGNDTTNIQAIIATTTVNGEAGADRINVSSNAPINSGTLNNISALLTVNGGDGTDTLNVSDAGDTSANLGTLTATTLTGLGLSDGIGFATVETIAVYLGSGDDTFTVQVIPDGTANLDGGAGNDQLFGPNTINTWNITGTNAGTLNTTVHWNAFENLTGGDQPDTFIFADQMGISGILDGGAGSDSLNYDAYTTPVTIRIPNGPATGTGGVLNIENARLGAGDDALIVDGPLTAPMNLDGGGGTNSLIVYTNNAGADNVTLTNTILVLGQVITYAQFQHLDLDTIGGADAITIYAAGLGFPSRVDVSTGSGDDRIIIHLGNPLIATTISIDADEPGASDSVIVNGTAMTETFNIADASWRTHLLMGVGPVLTVGATRVNLSSVEDLWVYANGGNDGMNVHPSLYTTVHLNGSSEPSTVNFDGDDLSVFVWPGFWSAEGRQVVYHAWFAEVRGGNYRHATPGPEYYHVVSGQQVVLHSDSPTTLELPDGNWVIIPDGLADTASVERGDESNLQGALPAGWEYVAAIEVYLFRRGTELSVWPGGAAITISFVIPPAYLGRQFAILYWNGSGWVEIPASVTADGRAVGIANLPGYYVLVARR